MALSEAALTLVATVEAELGLAAGADARLEGWVEDASDLVSTFVGYALNKRTVTETHYGDWGSHLILKARPVIGLTAVVFNSVPLVADNFQIYDDVAGLVFLPGGIVSTLASTGGISSGPRAGTFGNKLYSITYVAGYVTPRQAQAGSGSLYEGAAVTLPRAIQRAAIEMVAYLRARAGSDPGISSESMMGYSVSYRDENDAAEGIPASVRAKLSGFRDVVMA